MAEIIKVQKGTKDILPQEINLWHFMEQKALEVVHIVPHREAVILPEIPKKVLILSLMILFV